MWKLCDGKRTVSELTEALAREVKSPVDEKLVWVTLKKLWKSGLLVRQEDAKVLLSRRAFVGKMKVAAGAALALPIIVSVLVPTPVEAASCAMQGQSCATTPCCAGLHCLISLLCGL